MDPFANINPVLLSASILVLIVLLEKNVNWNDKSHPLTLFRYIAKALGEKAANSQGRSSGQQTVSGMMAFSVLILPVVIVIVTVKWFAEYTWFFDAFFLFVALSFSSVTRKIAQIAQFLQKDKRALARNILSTVVLRETENLSKVGIIKASMETQILRFHYQYISVIFWYLIAGGAGAIVYRCCFELSQAWNVKQHHFSVFGKPVAWLNFMLQWLPIRISTFLFAVSLGLSGSFSAIRNLRGNLSSHSLILATFAGALKCQLGGPAFYGSKKIRLPKCGTETLPGLEDARRLGVLMIQQQLLLTMLIFLGYCSAWFIHRSIG